ncbi:unnamed protein product [Symbiodinium microadriaticum]|nr:unnamed protein product [Symbiodinium microadriaticum]
MAAATLDSTVEFAERAKKLKLPTEASLVLSDAGIDSFGKLCFSVSSSPHNIDDASVERWMERIFAHHPLEEGHKTTLRKLLFESQGLTMDFKQRLEPPIDPIAKKLPAAERISRAQRRQQRITGLVYTPDTTPAHFLTDLFVEQLDQGVVSWISPDRCTSRSMEMASQKRDKSLQLAQAKLTETKTKISNGELNMKDIFEGLDDGQIIQLKELFDPAMMASKRSHGVDILTFASKIILDNELTKMEAGVNHINLLKNEMLSTFVESFAKSYNKEKGYEKTYDLNGYPVPAGITVPAGFKSIDDFFENATQKDYVALHKQIPENTIGIKERLRVTRAELQAITTEKKKMTSFSNEFQKKHEERFGTVKMNETVNFRVIYKKPNKDDDDDDDDDELTEENAEKFVVLCIKTSLEETLKSLKEDVKSLLKKEAGITVKPEHQVMTMGGNLLKSNRMALFNHGIRNGATPTPRQKRRPRPKPKQNRLDRHLEKNAGAAIKSRMISDGNRDTKVTDVGTGTDAMGEVMFIAPSIDADATPAKLRDRLRLCHASSEIDFCVTVPSVHAVGACDHAARVRSSARGCLTLGSFTVPPVPTCGLMGASHHIAPAEGLQARRSPVLACSIEEVQGQLWDEAIFAYFDDTYITASLERVHESSTSCTQRASGRCGPKRASKSTVARHASGTLQARSKKASRRRLAKRWPSAAERFPASRALLLLASWTVLCPSAYGLAEGPAFELVLDLADAAGPSMLPFRA